MTTYRIVTKDGSRFRVQKKSWLLPGVWLTLTDNGYSARALEFDTRDKARKWCDSLQRDEAYAAKPWQIVEQCDVR